jgi:hypothetical protein
MVFLFGSQVELIFCTDGESAKSLLESNWMDGAQGAFHDAEKVGRQLRTRPTLDYGASRWGRDGVEVA